jgi:hypothetical protein
MKSSCKKCGGGEVVFVNYGRLCLKCLAKKLKRPSLTIDAVKLLGNDEGRGHDALHRLLGELMPRC